MMNCFRYKIKLLSISICFLLIFISINCNGKDEVKNEDSTVVKSDINFVKDKYTDGLMKIPGVVGVYVGETEQKQPCITVMVKEETEVIKKEIPKELEDYPVIIEVTGEIKPM
ncbi:MAG: hypothetical protein HZB59_12535 [Ignavibacteriales bacterium]|nr:hypothetical protein [Ignavibacteriales bacterium]